MWILKKTKTQIHSRIKKTHQTRISIWTGSCAPAVIKMALIERERFMSSSELYQCFPSLAPCVWRKINKSMINWWLNITTQRSRMWNLVLGFPRSVASKEECVVSVCQRGLTAEEAELIRKCQVLSECQCHTLQTQRSGCVR